MKKAKLLFNEAKLLTADPDKDITGMLWQLICYSPKIPLRFQQQQLLDEATPFSLEVFDPQFTHTNLSFNGFKWGTGKRKVLLTHGWGSKAADFMELITELRKIEDLEIIAFDAPGNGSSIAELSNMLLFVRAIEAIMKKHGAPDVIIGHSLGAMANIFALNVSGVKAPSLIISIAPLIKLKENFAALMDSVGTSQKAQGLFFDDFKKIFEMDLADVNWKTIYPYKAEVKHWLAYNPDDIHTPYAYIADFLTMHPYVSTESYDIPHEKLQRDPIVINDILQRINLIDS